MTRRRWQIAILAVAAMLLLAGCTASRQKGNNPWGVDPVNVYIDKQLPIDDYDPIIIDALEYWEENDHYTDYSVNFSLVDDRGSADLVIAVRDEVSGLEKCGFEGPLSKTMGCAPQLTEVNSQHQTTVYVWRGVMNKDYADEVVRHELGHVLGLGHSDEPRNIMDPKLATVG